MEKLMTMQMDEEKLNAIDNYWRKNGFHTRSEFVRFACSRSWMRTMMIQWYSFKKNILHG